MSTSALLVVKVERVTVCWKFIFQGARIVAVHRWRGCANGKRSNTHAYLRWSPCGNLSRRGLTSRQLWQRRPSSDREVRRGALQLSKCLSTHRGPLEWLRNAWQPQLRCRGRPCTCRPRKWYWQGSTWGRSCRRWSLPRPQQSELDFTLRIFSYLLRYVSNR